MSKNHNHNQQQEKSFHALPVQEVLSSLGSQPEGLNDKEIDKRLKEHGFNKLVEGKKKSILTLILSQLNNPVIYLLVAAATISFIFGDIPEAIAIIVVIVLNTIIGFWMEYQAQLSMETLKKMDKLTARVIRNGETTTVDAEKLVPGDILELEAGALTPADARIIEASELSVDESPLTGESVPVNKNAEPLEDDVQLADRTNMLFKGTAISTGKGKAVVTSTGMQTQIGHISQMVSESEEDEIPLNKKLRKLTHKLIWVTLGLAAAFFVIGWIAGKQIYDLLQTAIAWTVAAIPEGLAIVASIALARGMIRLSRQQVLVKKLAAVETLGETTTIFTDKTGTLTENILSVSSVVYPENRVNLDEDEFNLEDKNLEQIFRIAVYCNDAELDEEDGNSGDPLEIALLKFAKDTRQEKYDDYYSDKRVHEDPFDSESKKMGTIYETDEGLYIAGKGAVESIIENCTHYLDQDKQHEIDEDFRKKWIEKNNELSAEGLRVLAFAYQVADKSEKGTLQNQDDFLNDMIFAGLVCFMDPPRQEIAGSMEICKEAGISVVMVTGDHPETALNIARKVKLVDEEYDTVIHGRDIPEKIDGPGDNLEKYAKAKVFARVDPRQKLQLVELFRKNGDIVGMTGDGVNDAPALKKADIGIAMGKRGTQVAQEVADMVLQDDAFPSIVKAIEQGRIIFGNIRKFIMYQLSYHLSEIIIIAGISFGMFQLPLLPLQLLFLNLLSDVFPALALGIGKGTPHIMKLPPKDPAEPIITKHQWYITGIYGFIIAIVIGGVYVYSYYARDYSQEICNTITFFSLAFAQLLHVFDMREANEPVFLNQVTRNKYVWFALILCFAVLFVAYNIPLLKTTLSFQQLDATMWIIVSVASILPILLIQAVKHIFKL